MSFPQGELWARIAAFELDRPGDALGFSGRLARDNAWTRTYALRVIEEYKRFVFLAMISEQPVTPSDAVDQAWHEHLTYTRSYWDEFCGGVLGRKLHHDPTRGGRTEGAKFRGWYARTLALYAETFGEAPPADIWPCVEERFREAPHFARINTASNWLVPKPRLQRMRWAAAGAGVLALAGCTPVVFGGVWPFTLNGSEFLKVFPVLWLGAIAVAWVWRNRLCSGTGGATSESGDVDPYVVAWVEGGVGRVAEAAVASLGARGAMVLESKHSTRVVAKGEPEPGWHPIERVLHERVKLSGGRATFTDLQAALHAVMPPLNEEAVKRGWLLDDDARRRARWSPTLLALAPLLLGVARVTQGLANDRPVGKLVGLMIVGMAIALLMFLRAPRRTPASDRWLREQKRQHANLRRPTQPTRELAGGMLPMAVALFGATALADTELRDLRKALVPPPSDGGGNIETGGGCSSGGDSGGGSGCGGCGGGD